MKVTLTQKPYFPILKKLNDENRFFSDNCDTSNYSYQNTKIPKTKAKKIQIDAFLIANIQNN